MFDLPIFLNLRDAPVLVVGGGRVAERRVERLLRSGARVLVVAPRLTERLRALFEAGALRWVARPFEPSDVEREHRLVFAATDEEGVNRRVAECARAMRVPVNVADCRESCDFALPAIVDRSPLQVAVGSGGASPLLARLVRARIEAALPSGLGALASWVERHRRQVQESLPDAEARRRLWEEVLEGPLGEMVLAGRADRASAALDTLVERFSRTGPRLGEVYLVGAGPGDPDLLTLRALRLMQRADVVLHDRLVAPAVLELVRREAERVDVGKREGHHPVSQERIQRIMVERARAGARVLRLKGGDPFVFGRGGEEIAHLAAEGIPFQVVPAVTAANGCAAYAGIPLTHRDHAQLCILATGHRRRDGTLELPWEAMARPNQTLVFYMALHTLPRVCENLQAHGMPPETPVAVVHRGTWADQRVVEGSLADIVARVAAAGLRPPALVFVGDVVRLRPRLAWFTGVAEAGDSALRGSTGEGAQKL